MRHKLGRLLLVLGLTLGSASSAVAELTQHELIGKRTVKRNDLRDQPLLLYDSPVKVLYIDDEQHRML